MTQCPCCSKQPFDECCGPILASERDAASAEALMRSRYTAFVKGDINHIQRTMHPKTRDQFDEAATRSWSTQSEWLGLEILSVQGGGPKDAKGTVEFIAQYERDSEPENHHELAQFEREGNRWYFVDGDLVGATPYVRETPKVGRNEPCPCGSGKKYKKCCA